MSFTSNPQPAGRAGVEFPHNPRPVTSEAADWHLWCEHANPNARQRLIERNVNIVLSIANKLASRLPVAAEELAGDGWAALLDAVDRFDPHRRVKFSTFAGPRIQGAILDAVRDRDRDVGRVARTRQKIESEAVHTFRAQHGRPPTDVELQSLLPTMGTQMRSNWREDVRRASPVSLDAPRDKPGHGTVVTQHEQLAAEDIAAARVDDRDEIEAMLIGLPATVVATIRTMLDDPDDASQASVAGRRGVSKSAIQHHVASAREHFIAYRRGERFSPALAPIIETKQAATRPTVPADLLPILSPRERQVVELRAAGMTAKSIAQRIGRGVENVNRLAALARRRIDAAIAARANGQPVGSVASNRRSLPRSRHPAIVLLIDFRPRREVRRAEPIAADSFHRLTERQRQCATLRGAGLTHAQIGQRLGIGPATVICTLKDARKRLRRIAEGAANA